MGKHRYFLGYAAIPTWAYERMIGRGMHLRPRKLYVTQTAAELDAEQSPGEYKQVYRVYMEEK